VKEAETHFQEARFVEALSVAKKAVANGGGAEAWIILGKTNKTIEDYQAAAQAYAKALQLAPRDQRARDGLRKANEALQRSDRD
jgi:cytochrome c-type biogenesis protein CcmH/NrfG